MSDAAASAGGNRPVLLAVAWLWVVLPFAYGVYELGVQVVPLLSG